MSQKILLLQFFSSLGQATAGLFFPFLIGEVYHLDFSQIILVMAAVWIMLAILVWPVNYLCKNLSIGKSLALGQALLAIFYLLLSQKIPTTFFLVFIIILLAVHMAIYWPHLHLISHHHTDQNNRGNFFANFQIIVISANIIAPFISGFFLDQGQAQLVMIIAALFFLLAMWMANNFHGSNIPKKIHNFSQTKTILTQNFPKKNLIFPTIAEASQRSALSLIYAILLKITLVSYALMGALIGVMAFVEIIASKIFGKITDKISPSKMLRLGIYARMLDIIPRSLIYFFPNIYAASVLSIFAGILGPTFQPAYYARLYQKIPQDSDQLSYWIVREWVLGCSYVVYLIVTFLLYQKIGEISLPIMLILAGLSPLLMRKF